jgi:hypothetical protein
MADQAKLTHYPELTYEFWTWTDASHMACEPNLIYCAYCPTVAVETASTKSARNSSPAPRSTDKEQRISQIECVK